MEHIERLDKRENECMHVLFGLFYVLGVFVIGFGILSLSLSLFLSSSFVFFFDFFGAMIARKQVIVAQSRTSGQFSSSGRPSWAAHIQARIDGRRWGGRGKKEKHPWKGAAGLVS